MKTLIYYHNSCLDGSTAAAVAGLAFTGTETHYCPIDYNAGVAMAEGTPIDELSYAEYSNVIFVDFSPNATQLANLTYHLQDPKHGKTLYVLDHHGHVTVEAYEAACKQRGVVPCKDVIFQSSVSGSMLAYTKFLPNLSAQSFKGPLTNKLESLAPVVQHVSDYDTWQTDKKRAFTFYFGVIGDVMGFPDLAGQIYRTDLPPTVSRMRSIIAQQDLSLIMDHGINIEGLTYAQIDEDLKETGKYYESTDLIKAPHATFTVQRKWRDFAAKRAMEKFGVSIAINVVTDVPNVFWSVRSEQGAEICARDVCIPLSGNGHEHSAGCQMETELFLKHYA